MKNLTLKAKIMNKLNLITLTIESSLKESGSDRPTVDADNIRNIDIA